MTGSGVTDIALANIVAAAFYTAPLRLKCVVPRAPLHRAGDPAAIATSELLLGERFDLFEIVGDWGFGQCVHDGYTGWTAMAALGDASIAPARAITARSALVFALGAIKAPVIAELPFGALVTGAEEGHFLALAGGGFVHLAHLAAVASTPIAIARGFLGAPYLWGGRTPFGVDCSGLVQAALMAGGIACPSDSDQQSKAVGVAVEFAARQNGDLVFFPGHVGMLFDADTLLHANAHWMAVVEEPLADVIGRGAVVTGVRRVLVS